MEQDRKKALFPVALEKLKAFNELVTKQINEIEQRIKTLKMSVVAFMAELDEILGPDSFNHDVNKILMGCVFNKTALI